MTPAEKRFGPITERELDIAVWVFHASFSLIQMMQDIQTPVQIERTMSAFGEAVVRRNLREKDRARDEMKPHE